jgi:serine phosphatase RsbU (regulator of sigma subunit)
LRARQPGEYAADVSQFEDDEPLTVFGGSFAPSLQPAAEAVGHYLLITDGTDVGKHIEVGENPITIGRGAGQTLVVAGDALVSRQHARVSMANGQVVAADLGSTNGTFVNAQRITGSVPLKEGQHLRIGHQVLKYERKSRRDVERAEESRRDLQKATNYVLALLPPPIDAGPVRAEWHFHPSAQLGGDAFGYDWLDSATFVFYLIDVSGHGVGSAMHSVSAMNVLRQRALPGVNFRNPAEVLTSLNARFQMDRHHGLYFTMWNGLYDTATRTLTYSSAGHHPAFLVPEGGGSTTPLGEPDLMLGIVPDQTYQTLQTTIPAGSRLYLFSDGVFEIIAKDDSRWSLDNFLPMLKESDASGIPSPRQLFEQVKEAARPGGMEDDFSLLAVTFL